MNKVLSDKKISLNELNHQDQTKINEDYMMKNNISSK